MRITVKNGLRHILTERRISSASQFARLMAPYLGKTLSTSQITRYMRDDPPAFDLKFIDAACNALRCLPTALFRIRIECGPDDSLADLGPLPKHVEVVRSESRLSPGGNTDPPADAGALQSDKAQSRVKESIHTGPKADVCPAGGPRVGEAAKSAKQASPQA